MTNLRLLSSVLLLLSVACSQSQAPFLPADGGACGAAGEPCCASDSCGLGLQCAGDVCQPTRATEVGKPCTRNGDCTSGVCLPLANGTNVCSTTCSSAPACLPGWSCDALAGQPASICQCTPSPERCDGLDNDCNGLLDDDPSCAACTSQADCLANQICDPDSHHCIAPPPDAGTPDGGVQDADAGPADSGVVIEMDAGTPDSGFVIEMDAGAPDSGIVIETDAGTPDSGVVIEMDAGIPDSGVVIEMDAGTPDSGIVVSDAGAPDSGVVVTDAGAADSGVVVTDAGAADAGVVIDTDAGIPDSGVVVDAGIPDAGVVVADAGAPDSGVVIETDAGTVTDAGIPDDDAGLPVDAGTIPDAGDDSDAGSPADGGQATDGGTCAVGIGDALTPVVTVWDDFGQVDPPNAVIPPFTYLTLDACASLITGDPITTYDWQITSAPVGSVATITGAGPAVSFVPGAIGSYVVALTTTTAGGESAQTEVTLTIGSSSARVLVQLTWPESYGDVDLHYIGPGGAFYSTTPYKGDLDWEYSLRTAYGNEPPSTNPGAAPAPDWGAPCSSGEEGCLIAPDGDLWNDAQFELDQREGYGPEIVTHALPFDGTYLIAVHYYCAGFSGGTTITPVIDVFVDGLLQWTGTADPLTEEQVWDAAQIVVSGGGTVVDVIPLADPPRTVTQGCHLAAGPARAGARLPGLQCRKEPEGLVCAP